jgi:hypothetical protein
MACVPIWIWSVLIAVESSFSELAIACRRLLFLNFDTEIGAESARRRMRFSLKPDDATLTLLIV